MVLFTYDYKKRRKTMLKLTLKKQLIILVLCALIIPTSVLGFLTSKEAEVLKYTSVSGTKEELESLSKYFKDFFNEAEDKITNLSNASEMQVNSFQFPHYSGDGAKYAHLPAASDSQKQAFYENYLADYTEHDLIINAYIGTVEGAFYLHPIPPKHVDLTGYDPRSRGWYELAIQNPNKVVWTEPYIDASSGATTITYAKTVHSNGEIIGVVGIDFDLNQMSSLMHKSIVSNTIFTILVSIFIGFIAVYFFARYFGNKIKVIEDTITFFSQGNLAYRSQLKGTDEISRIGEKLDQMGETWCLLLDEVKVATKTVEKNNNGYSNSNENVCRAIGRRNSSH